MSRRGCVSLCLGLFAVTGPGEAQEFEFSISKAIERWSGETGVFVLPAAEQYVLKTVAERFTNDAISAAIAPAQAKDFATYIEGGGDIVSTPEGLSGRLSDGTVVALMLGNQLQRASMQAALNYEVVQTALYEMPTIVVQVKPVPPRDYMIPVNGMPAGEGEKDEFKVQPGLCKVKVTREGKPECTWEGMLSEGDVQPINCQL